MDNQALLKTAIKFGTITGLGNIAFFFLLYFMGKNPLGNWSWLGVWIPILLIVLGTKEHRNKDLGGYMNYRRGLGMGMMITLFTAILFSMFVYTFGNFFDANILQMQKDEITTGMQAIDENKDAMIKIIGEDKYDKSMEAMQKSHDTMTMALVSMGQFEIKLFGGFIISLIVAAFVKKKRPLFDDLTPPSLPPINDNE